MAWLREFSESLETIDSEVIITVDFEDDIEIDIGERSLWVTAKEARLFRFKLLRAIECAEERKLERKKKRQSGFGKRTDEDRSDTTEGLQGEPESDPEAS